MPELTVADVITQVFTTANPTTGHAPPEHVAWALFANETVFLTMPTEALPVDASPAALKSAAQAALLELGPPRAGTPSADFRVVRLPWFPDDYVYMVSYSHPNIFNIIIADEETSDLVAGMTARATREMDVEQPDIIAWRDFAGATA